LSVWGRGIVKWIPYFLFIVDYLLCYPDRIAPASLLIYFEIVDKEIHDYYSIRPLRVVG